MCYKKPYTIINSVIKNGINFYKFVNSSIFLKYLLNNSMVIASFPIIIPFVKVYDLECMRHKKKYE